jgi:hypothetical protein
VWRLEGLALATYYVTNILCFQKQRASLLGTGVLLDGQREGYPNPACGLSFLGTLTVKQCHATCQTMPMQLVNHWGRRTLRLATRWDTDDSVAWLICVWLATGWLPCSVPPTCIHSASRVSWLDATAFQLGVQGKDPHPQDEILSTKGPCHARSFLSLSHI